ncbi:MAG: transcriptional repressor NrdR [Candidatus Dadabacteria bacterium]|nr:MAG: transcriptional repressor NrdR [Candidatus Dadabacteria bacterium]
MKCPLCGCERSNVIDSRSSPEMIRRRRVCAECDHRFTTYERVEYVAPMIIKKDGRREEFDRNKIRAGIIKACEKRPVSMDVIDSVVAMVEAKVNQSDKKEISSLTIGEHVMHALRDIDQVAYVRFASVYREFSDISQFMETLQGLLEPGKERH